MYNNFFANLLDIKKFKIYILNSNKIFYLCIERKECVDSIERVD